MMEMNSEFCVNCGSATGLRALQDEQILHCVREWTAPRMLQNHDVLCTVCWNEANKSLTNICHIARNCALCNKTLTVRTRSHQIMALRTDTQYHVNIKNIILERLMPVQVCSTHIICHPCWQKADRAAKHYLVLSSRGTSSSSSLLRCANCGINIVRMKRHILNNENILCLIQQQAAPRIVTSNDYICDACHTIFIEVDNLPSPQIPAPSVGHINVCSQCGCSLAHVRSHTVEGTDRICHRCFRRTQAHSRSRDPVPQLGERITLPNYKRAPDTHSRCLFPACNSTSQQMVPFVLRVRLFRDHKYYIPRDCRICGPHLQRQMWSELYEGENVLNSFTAAYIEDFCELLKND